MKQIVIDYSDYELSNETVKQLKKADLCNEVIKKKRPFEGEMLKIIQDFYRIDTTWSSSALEGNSYTISETKVILEEGITVAGKPLKHTLEICGHGDAYDYMFSLLHQDGIRIKEIGTIHQYLMQKEIGNEAGKYKTEENLITGSDYSTIGVEQVKCEMEKLEEWMEQKKHRMHPIQFAAEVHRKLVYIHPFCDGNGRTARLVMNGILIQNGYLPCVISPVIRLEYIQALEAGRNGKNNEFIRLIAEAETETEKDFIRGMHLDMPDFSEVNVREGQDMDLAKQDMFQELRGMTYEL